MGTRTLRALLEADRRIDQPFLEAALAADIFVVPSTPVLAGTDAPNPATTCGATLHTATAPIAGQRAYRGRLRLPVCWRHVVCQ